MDSDRLAYLRLLAEQYPTIQAASTAIIRKTSQLSLPKGTEHFVSDIHGEYEAFQHVLRNGSGSLRRRIFEQFADDLGEEACRNLATLIYYPQRKLSLVTPTLEDPKAWYHQTLLHLIAVCRMYAAKYPRTQVEQYLPDYYDSIIEELLFEKETMPNRSMYYNTLLESIIETGSAEALIIALAELIKTLSIAQLHVIGDVYDRGPGAHLIMDLLLDYHDVDIQWGNHDIVWMGAAAGSEACVANVVRLSLRYANMETLEDGYGISLLPLASLALDLYGDHACEQFIPKDTSELTEYEQHLMACMHKAVSIIQFKLEGQIIQRRPHYHMEDRLLLDKIDLDRGTVCVNGQHYDLLDTHFPTLDPDNPYTLTEREANVVRRLRLSFQNSKWLQRHVRFLFNKGSMYLVYNGNLMYHGCIPMTEDGEFMPFEVDGEAYAAREFMDRVERLARQGYFSTDPEAKLYGQDAMWYLWSGAQSPLFGKAKMATFERYFIADKSTHKETRNAYYAYRDDEATACKILEEFGLNPQAGHIINGHVPVKVKEGESPVKAGGKLLVIDGGFAEAYHERTGIAGYTLVFNSYGLLLAAHQPFESIQKAVEEELDIDSRTEILEQNRHRIRVRDTDGGRVIQKQIDDLRDLLSAYRTGLIKEM